MSAVRTLDEPALLILDRSYEGFRKHGLAPIERCGEEVCLAREFLVEFLGGCPRSGDLRIEGDHRIDWTGVTASTNGPAS